MDISRYAAKAESYERLSTFQISQFFKRHVFNTREDCDRLAANILNGLVSPTPVQGATSYTVAAAGSRKVVQFRSSKLDMECIENARLSYRGFVPNCELYGTAGDIYVYVWDLVPGPAFCQVRRQFLSLGIGMEQRLHQTVLDFARFFASAWNNRPAVKQPTGILKEYREILDQLSLSLPNRLQLKLDQVRQGLPLLFRPGYPMALQHDDLLENNIHIDEVTGHITGIVDWADAIVAPFGVSLGGLETIIGVQTASSWHFHPSHVSLRQHFWDMFYREIGDISEEDQRSIEIARLFGLFRTHGFEGEKAAAYLGALCLL
ncbi:hypothetical protein McanMca71_007960 [Microsporum canis]|uniref:Aminoglycoside phosphotransferase domain-containing protein n=1 Tax=Arthroderma otae (strain ATCC MYA-4605 / CBS 113480) TaxID=554155 RepID=C5FJZ7_ARTOC|nr:conserved hypothetical protein [Microsporum canis CBS 113480]EEQ30019.1 conserved hypothetical protein [Microsporum canis CBS 113480]